MTELEVLEYLAIVGDDLRRMAEIGVFCLALIAGSSFGSLLHRWAGGR